MTFVTIESTARAALLASVSQRRQHAGVAALSMISDGLLLQVQDMAHADCVGQAQQLVSMIDYSSILSPTKIPTSAAAMGLPSLQVLVSSLLLVTASDMVPFVPCQPLAISMGATLGIWAFPICVTGQTMAGILAFLASRKAADSQQVQQVLDGLGSQQARDKFQEIRQLGTQDKEEKVLLALIGLRLAPFFPFSAGNYLLGGGTGVGLRPFIIATIFGCLLSNLLSVSVGIGGSELLQSHLP